MRSFAGKASMRSSLLERMRTAVGTSPEVSSDPLHSVVRHAEDAVLAAIREGPRFDEPESPSRARVTRRRVDQWHVVLARRIERAVETGDPRVRTARCRCIPGQRRPRCLVELDLELGDPVEERGLRFEVDFHGEPRPVRAAP